MKANITICKYLFPIPTLDTGPAQSTGENTLERFPDDRNRLSGRQEQTLMRFTWNLTGNTSAAETLRCLARKHNLCPGLTPKTRKSKVINEWPVEAQCDILPHNERPLSHHQSGATKHMALTASNMELKSKTNCSTTTTTTKFERGFIKKKSPK